LSGEKAVDLPQRATPIEPGEPVAAFDVRSGGTFAERRKAREAADKKESKAVEADEAETVENKSVPRKRAAKK
jgi:hypothetical protein